MLHKMRVAVFVTMEVKLHHLNRVKRWRLYLENKLSVIYKEQIAFELNLEKEFYGISNASSIILQTDRIKMEPWNDDF